MSTENLLIELMEQMLPDHKPFCPNCLSEHITMNADYDIFCHSCNTKIRPGKEMESQRVYYQIMADGLVFTIKGLGFAQDPDNLKLGLGKLENGLKRLIKRKATPQDYYLLSLANLIKSGLQELKGNKVQAFRLLKKARKNLETGNDFQEEPELKKAALFDDLLAYKALEYARDEESEIDIDLDREPAQYYERALEAAQSMLAKAEQANESDQSEQSSQSRKLNQISARQFLALQYLLQALYLISKNEAHTDQVEEDFLDTPLFDSSVLDDFEAQPVSEEEIEAPVLKMLAQLSEWKEKEAEKQMEEGEVVEPALIEHLPELARWYQDIGDWVMADQLESLSFSLAKAYWKAHLNQYALELMTENTLAFFKNALDEGESEKAQEVLDLWFKEWQEEKARELLAKQGTVMLVYRRENDAIYFSFTKKLMLDDLAAYMKKTVAYLNSLPEGGSYYYNQFLKAQICAKIAMQACLKRDTKEVLKYVEEAVSTWAALARSYPELLGISEDLSYELADLRFCRMYLQDNLKDTKPLKKIADQVNEIYALLKRSNNPHARAKAYFDESVDLF